MKQKPHLHNDNLRGVAIGTRRSLPPLRNLCIACQQNVTFATAGKREMQCIRRAQLRQGSDASCSYKDFAPSWHQLQRLEKHEELLLQSVITLLQRFYKALHQRQAAGAEDGTGLCLQGGTNLRSVRSILNEIDDHACIQVDYFYSSARLSHKSRSAWRYASTSSREGGGVAEGKTCRIVSRVPITRAREPLGNRAHASSFRRLLVRRSHCSSMSRASSSGLQRRWAAHSRSSCQSHSSTSIVNLGMLSPKEDCTRHEKL